jgi:hypothetical protein
MKTIEIYWHQYDANYYLTSPLSLDELGFPPEPLIQTANKKAVYFECPAWKHKAERTFTLRSPIDITIEIDYPNVISPNISPKQFDDWVSGSFHNKNWYSEELVTLQFTIPAFLFWTKQKNVWLEMRASPKSSLKNNFTLVPGWWSISKWPRPTSFALDVIDKTKPIIIKRGDPICEVCFYSDDLNNKIKLIKKIPERNFLDDVMKRLSAKKYIRHLFDNYIFQKQTSSKCPFSFLWSNTPQDKG